MAAQLPPVLRQAALRDQLAQARGYGSIADRSSPLQYGSLFQQRYPGAVPQVNGADIAQQQQATQLKRLQTNLSLRQTQLAMSDFDSVTGLRRQRNQLAAYRANQAINPRYANLGLEPEEQQDPYDDE